MVTNDVNDRLSKVSMIDHHIISIFKVHLHAKNTFHKKQMTMYNFILGGFKNLSKSLPHVGTK